MNQYVKPFLSLQQQVDLLKGRGLVITNDERAKHYLGKVNYYRLSAYWYPFRERVMNVDGTSGIGDNFQRGVHFSHILDLYIFDKKLRMICLDALERIEIALRTDITISLAQLDPFAHRDPAQLNGHFSRKRITPHAETKHEKWLRMLDDKAQKSQEHFAKHFKAKYPKSDMPIWIASELWDFGALSHLYEGLIVPSRDTIAALYQVPSGAVLQSWVRSLNDIRNVCAHHSRLWNKPQVNQPVWPTTGQIPDFDHLTSNTKAQTRLYSALLIMRHILKTISPNSTWHLWLIEHCDTFPTNPYVSLKNAGFPDDWKTLSVWAT